MSVLDTSVAETKTWLQGERFKDTTRLYSARQVVQQRGTIQPDYTVARQAADAFYKRLRELFSENRSITTFGPYSPGQAVTMRRKGIEGIYLGGWATSAKGSINEDPGPDLASYPLSQVPDEAALVVRALLTADKNQTYARSRMSAEALAATAVHDFRPFIIADADTGHGGDPHVRNLIRRFVEVGVPGYHIEDQRPGSKKCGHQGGKVLVPEDEQIKRLNAARFQLDIMGVAGIIVARTDAEAANLLESMGDERDQPFVLGSTITALPSYKLGYLGVLKCLYDAGVEEVNGHLLYAVPEEDYDEAKAWIESSGLSSSITACVTAYRQNPDGELDPLLDKVVNDFVDAWQSVAEPKTFAQAVADDIEYRLAQGETLSLSVEQWVNFARRSPLRQAKSKAQEMGIEIMWDAEHARTPEGYFQVKGSIDFAVAKSLAAAPFADVLWMETKTADLADAKEFADAIHAVYPEKMLAYNLSPSFNWDTTGMSDDDMRVFPEELAKLGFVFNFITYGGHQIDGLAGEEFAQALGEEGMLALARLQRKFRLLESPFSKPQTLAGGPRLDGALAASSGRTATTKAMGKGSTQFQHTVQTEVPPSQLQDWINTWRAQYSLTETLSVELRPHRAGSDLLELRVSNPGAEQRANVIFSTMQDRRGRTILEVRDQNTFAKELRRKRLMTLMHLFLIHRYKCTSVHYMSPTEDNQLQTKAMIALGIYREVNNEVGEIIVADVDGAGVEGLLDPEGNALQALIGKTLQVDTTTV